MRDVHSLIDIEYQDFTRLQLGTFTISYQEFSVSEIRIGLGNV